MNVIIVAARNHLFSLFLYTILAILTLLILRGVTNHQGLIVGIPFILSGLYNEIEFLYFKKIGQATLKPNSIILNVINESSQEIKLTNESIINIYDEESFKNVFKLYHVKRIHIYSKEKSYDEQLLFIRKSNYQELKSIIKSWQETFKVNE